MKWAETAKIQANRFFTYRDATYIPARKNQEESSPQADQHANYTPNDGGEGKIAHDLVIVIEFFDLHYGLVWLIEGVVVFDFS